jgi:hypothetical protein
MNKGDFKMVMPKTLSRVFSKKNYTKPREWVQKSHGAIDFVIHKKRKRQ